MDKNDASLVIHVISIPGFDDRVFASTQPPKPLVHFQVVQLVAEVERVSILLVVEYLFCQPLLPIYNFVLMDKEMILMHLTDNLKGIVNNLLEEF